jgi:diguanylate cyclase (GGDEF)-like protein/PAS domain S-box-containing protein
MKNENKTKERLIQELIKIQKKNTDLEEIIIEEKRTKKELKESEKKYKDLVEETPLGLLNIGITGKIIYINKRLEEISGYSREEIVGKNVFKLGIFPDEILKILKERLKVRLRGGSIHQRREVPFECKNGKWIWIEITAKLIKKWGIPANFRVTAQDITDRKKAEEELRDSEERLKILFDYAPDAYYISDIKGKFIDGNKAAERLLGYKKEELIGKSFLKLKLLSISDIPKAAKLLVKNLRGQPTGSDEFVLNRKDNSKVTVEISTYPVKIKGRTLALGIARDITERKNSERKLRTMESAIAKSINAIALADLKGNLTFVNSSFLKMWGYEKDKEVLGQSIIKFWLKSEDAEKIAKNLFDKGASIGELVGRRKDGSIFNVQLLASIVTDKSGKPVNMMASFIDITERKKAEKQLKELARIDSLTGCYSRRYGLELLDRQIKLSHRSKSPLLLTFLDVDDFKTINDTFGHDEGDKVLKESVELFKSTLREVDIICRMGGDEFLLIFPDSSLKEVSLIRGRLQKNLSQLNKKIKKNYQIKFSMGFSEYLPDKPETLDELIRIADQRMYDEKKKNKE